MTSLRERKIFKSQKSTPTVIKDLLQSLFVAELLVPGREIWIVSPWVSNVPIVDNRGGTFAMDPSWGRRDIRLADVLATLASHGTRVKLVYGPDLHNEHFITDLKRAFSERSLPMALLRCRNVDTLHAKGILSDSFFLGGSMNITYKGIYSNDELISLTVEPESVARTRLEFSEQYHLSEE